MTDAGAPPVVSIVLPTHNGGRFLREALESCLAQTYLDWELLAVDDASTDDTPAILAEYAARDPRILIRRNPVNLRLPASLNVGFARARGRYLTWTSDDNRYRPAALARLVAALERDPALDLVYARAATIGDDGRALGPEAVAGPETLALWNCVGGCFLYRRAVHEALGGYDEGRFLVEDYDFWLRTSARFRLALLDDDLYLYRRHAASLTATRSAAAVAAVEDCLLAHLPRLPWLTPATRRAAFDHLLLAALKRADRAAARRIFATAHACAIQGDSWAAPPPRADDEAAAFPFAEYADRLADFAEAHQRQIDALADGLEAERRERLRAEAAFRTVEAHVREQIAYTRRLEAALAAREHAPRRALWRRLLRR